MVSNHEGVVYFTLFYNIRKGQLKNVSCPYEVGLLKGGSHRIVLPFEALYMRVNSSNTIPKGCARRRYISTFFQPPGIQICAIAGYYTGTEI